MAGQVRSLSQFSLQHQIRLISYDPINNDWNIAERGLSFELIADLDRASARTREDTRRDYGERRLRVFALLGDRVHMAVITRRGDAAHVISFRKANKKEVAWYGGAG